MPLVTGEDITRVRSWLRTDAPKWAQAAVDRLDQPEAAGQLQVATHLYWASPSRAWEMPAGLQEDLTRSVLMISKGDVNYRRWLGDARWETTTPLERIIVPPAPRAAAGDEIGCGCRPAGAAGRKDGHA